MVFKGHSHTEKPTKVGSPKATLETWLSATTGLQPKRRRQSAAQSFKRLVRGRKATSPSSSGACSPGGSPSAVTAGVGGGGQQPPLPHQPSHLHQPQPPTNTHGQQHRQQLHQQLSPNSQQKQQQQQQQWQRTPAAQPPSSQPHCHWMTPAAQLAAAAQPQPLPLPVLGPEAQHRTLNNYLGIGIDAKVALEFHSIRYGLNNYQLVLMPRWHWSSTASGMDGACVCVHVCMCLCHVQSTEWLLCAAVYVCVILAFREVKPTDFTVITPTFLTSFGWRSGSL